MTAPGAQEVLIRLDQIERNLGDRIARLETAMTGDEAMGHRGVAGRIEKLELAASEAPNTHRLIADEAKEGRAELHKRVDVLWGEWTRTKYLVLGIALGISIVGGSLGTWLYNILAQGT